jgi:hypothetical protein
MTLLHVFVLHAKPHVGFVSLKPDNILVRKDLNVDEHERLSNITIRHKLK